MLFRGLSAFPVTPCAENGAIDVDALLRVLAPIRAAGVQSVGLLGSTGSYMFLERDQRRLAIEAAADFLGPDVPVIASVGSLRTDAAIALARDARDAGAAGLLLAPVSYTPLTDDEVFDHFMAVASVTDLPVCFYNNPGTTHFSIGAPLLSRLAGIDTVVAVKNPAVEAARMKETHDATVAAVRQDLAIGYSGDWLTADALLAGGAAWYSVIGGILPAQAVSLTRAALAGDATETRRLDDRLQPIWNLFRELSSYRVVHAAANILGLSPHQPPLPIQPLRPADRQRVEAALESIPAS